MSNLLHENLCKSKRQNTITGLLKKMAEKNVQDTSVQKSNFTDERTGDGTASKGNESEASTVHQFSEQDTAEMVQLEMNIVSDNSCAFSPSETEIANRKTQGDQAENSGDDMKKLPVNFVNAKTVVSDCIEIGSDDSVNGELLLDRQENQSCEIKPSEEHESNVSECFPKKFECQTAEKHCDASQQKDSTQDAILYTPGRRTRRGCRSSPKNIESRKRRNSKQTSVTSLTAYVCPVCCQNMLFKDLNQLNEHIDDCIAEKDINSNHFPAAINENLTSKVEKTGANFDAENPEFNVRNENIQSATDRTAEKTEKLNHKNGKSSKEENYVKDTDFLSTQKECIKLEIETKTDDIDTTKLTSTDCELQLSKTHENSETNTCKNISSMPDDASLQHKSGVSENSENDCDDNKNDPCEAHAGEKELKDASVAAGNIGKDGNKTDMDTSEFCHDEYVLKSDSYEMYKIEILSVEEDQIQAVTMSSEIKSSAESVSENIKSESPIETHWSANNLFDHENQCDIVSSTNENDSDKIECEDTTVQSEPDLPYLDPNLLEINGKINENNDSDVMKCEAEVKNNDNQIYDSVINSTSSSSSNNYQKIIDDPMMENLVGSLIDKTIAQNIDGKIGFKTGGCKKILDLDSPRKPDKTEGNSSGNCSTMIEKPHCSVDGTAHHVEICMDIGDNATDKDSMMEEDSSLLVCPVCNIEQRVTDLSGFNNHVDSCLSRGTISEILKEQKKNDSEKRSLPPGSGQKSVKRRKTSLKMPSCRSIASFFQEK